MLLCVGKIVVFVEKIVGVDVVGFFVLRFDDMDIIMRDVVEMQVEVMEFSVND